jgi:cysteine-rich repeat protein
MLPGMRRLIVVLAAASAAPACSFDATGIGPTPQSGPDDATTGGAATTTTTGDPPVPTSTDVHETTTTSPPPDPSTGPVDPVTSSSEGGDSSEGSSSSGGPPSCGNGVLEGDEACDDGNDIDTDACTSACVSAVCGDGFVQDAVEECDDQNVNEADGCTSACLLPTCSDAAVNGGETDIDCGGGMCPKCAVTQTCSGPSDCKTGRCDADVCVHAEHCKDLKSQGLPSGKYTIDPDGSDAGAPFAVWCEQDYAGGGWTLVLKVDGRTQIFEYDNQRWTNPNAYMADPGLGRTETKLRSFGTVAVDEVLVGMEAPIADGGPLTLEYIQLNLMDPAPSLASIFMAGTYVATNNPYADWQKLVPTPSLQANCRRQGFNPQADGDPPGNARVRIGIIGNENNGMNACGSHDSFLGVGASMEGDGCAPGYTATTGNGAVCGSDNGDVDTPGFAVVYVR